MKIYFIFLLAFGFLFLNQSVFAQSFNAECDEKLAYENRNQINPKPLRLKKVSGVVQDIEKVNIPDACVGIFKDEKLIKVVSTDVNGKFSFDFSEPGDYVLVIRYAPYCTANIPIKIVKDRRARRKSVKVTMEPSAIDTCSSGNYNQ